MDSTYNYANRRHETIEKAIPYVAVRELKEETGVEAKKLKQIYKCVSKDTIYYGYLCERDCDKESIILQEGETISYL